MSTQLSAEQLQTRSTKLKNASKIYVCECGKSYLAYPSIYLHFQKKHKISISTKSTANNKIITQVNGRIQQKYYFSQEFSSDRNQHQNQNDQMMKIDRITQKDSHKAHEFQLLGNVLTEYGNCVGELFAIDEERKLAQKLSIQLLRYLKNYRENNILANTDGFQLKQLLYFFNPFIHHKTKQFRCNFNDVRIVKMCKIFVKMASWLKRNKYTELTIEYSP